MSQNSYETIEFKILQYLKECRDNVEQINPDQIKKIADSVGSDKFVSVLSDLEKRGYVDKKTFEIDPQGFLTINILKDSPITDQGLQFLSENSSMTKLYKALKEVKFWLS
ncbi:hypothetical protein JF76_07480 [Lactobacillus kullabergensis]|uniref:YjcQ protein n=1 Tax=Lactobacillus kullabergensis TaxID=1218493 RepID=A0A0F4LC23_9LACO|nr:YjcQ family protein [Lactobacillus kullabergensis]KJY56140.1 hypothetical protein JF76_07480 [Lactobacillus kullabergensis]